MQSLPQFSNINPKHIYSELETILSHNREAIDGLLQQSNYTWDNFIQPLEALDITLSNFWSRISHLHSVVNSEELREAYNLCLPALTQYATELGLNRDLFKAYEAIQQSDAFKNFSAAQKKVIENNIRDFKLAGVALEGKDKEHYQAIALKLSELQNKFEQNLMDATDSYEKLIEDENLLAGIPDSAKAGFRQNAEKKQRKGWLIKLDFPSFYAVITYADHEPLRREIYEAYVTRASDVGPHDKQYDNTQVMFETLKLRDEKAKLLGFDSYAHYSLAPKMAKNPDAVMDFLHELAEKTKPLALQEWQSLQSFAKENLKLETLNAWDVAYASEKLKLQKHDLSDEMLRPYFEVHNVINGLFQVVQKLYQITICEKTSGVDTWHEDVTFYEIYDNNKNLIAAFYLDLYARDKKRGGAWMDECRTRWKSADAKLQLPIAFLTCNFTQPLKDKSALLTHNEVVTLFHEFGHGLHHMLTKIDIAEVAGINGVAWDAVEFPSQFMENWCWYPESLNLFACHYETKAPMPKALYEKLIASKNFQAGMQMLRQLEFSLFDFRIHQEFVGDDNIQATLNDVRRKIAVVPAPEFNRFQHSFSHIFAGGYAAGYYSYKWAEVLASDAFAKFKRTSVFDPVLGEKFKTCILEKGGSADPLELFVAFQGREPKVEALLEELDII